MTKQCRARQYSDEMHCPFCRLRWDTNDPEPPQCLRTLATAPPLAPERLPYASALAPKVFC